MDSTYRVKEESRVGPGMDPQQQFCLKWNSFGSNLATAFSNLFKSESLADVTLLCEGQTFRAHKLILAACSKHFQELFDTAPPSHLGPCFVILEATTAANMAALLEFMYKGEVHVSQEALSSFLKSAERLQVKGLSIEQEKIAYAQSLQHSSDRYQRSKLSPNGPIGAAEPADSAPATTFAPILPPYPYGHYLPSGHPIHPNMSTRRQQPTKASPSPSPHPRVHRPGSSSSQCADEPDTRTSPSGRCDDGNMPPKPCTPQRNNGYERSASVDMLLDQQPHSEQCAEDLRVKTEPDYHQGDYSTPSTPTASILANTYTDKQVEKPITPPNPGPESWKIKSNKSGGIATADGKKLKCPYCERLYGYETNLRAHIRQRHQGIRVHCPYCTRTFTRNNTVRRHIAREHKHEPLNGPPPLHSHAAQ